MTRDEAVKIAADAMRCQTDVEDWKLWTEFVVQGADALLAALGEQPRACDGVGANWRCSSIVRYVGDFVVNLDGTKHTCALPNDDAQPAACCAATEARVVGEIVEWLRRNGWNDVPRWIERGDWRAKGPR